MKALLQEFHVAIIICGWQFWHTNLQWSYKQRQKLFI